MDPFIRLTLSRILIPLCKPVHPHRLAAFEWSDAMWKKAELAADPKKAAQAGREAEEKEKAVKQARKVQTEAEAVGVFGL